MEQAGEGNPRWKVARFVAILAILLWPGVVMAVNPSTEKATDKTSETVISVPLPSLVLDEATVTVSVLQDPRPNFMGLCTPELLRELGFEEEDLAGQVRKICRTAEKLTKNLEQPTHELNPRRYVVTVPLTEPRGAMRSVLWTSHSLDEAITFLDLLQSKKVKAVNVFATVPWSTEAADTCVECPIKDLVFHAGKIKDSEGLFRGKDGPKRVQ